MSMRNSASILLGAQGWSPSRAPREGQWLVGELKAPLKSWGDRTLDLPMVMTRGSSACSPVFVMSPIPIAVVQKPLKLVGFEGDI